MMTKKHIPSDQNILMAERMQRRRSEHSCQNRDYCHNNTWEEGWLDFAIVLATTVFWRRRRRCFCTFRGLLFLNLWSHIIVSSLVDPTRCNHRWQKMARAREEEISYDRGWGLTWLWIVVVEPVVEFSLWFGKDPKFSHKSTTQEYLALIETKIRALSKKNTQR